MDDDVPFSLAATAGDDDGDAADDAPHGQTAAVVPTPALSADMTPLERARALAMSLGINKATPSTAAAPAQSPGLPPPPITADGKIDTKAALHRAKMIAMQMSGGGAGGGGADTEMHFMEELEINDYPPQVGFAELLS